MGTFPVAFHYPRSRRFGSSCLCWWCESSAVRLQGICLTVYHQVSLGQPATSIPIPVITGIIAGSVIGYIIYRSGSTIALSWFLVGSTYLLFLIGAGLFSKCIGFFEYYVGLDELKSLCLRLPSSS
jgi:high-affinity iron transporter